MHADGTLLVGYQQEHLQSFLDAVADTGAQYGMQLHWDKFQLLNVNRTVHLAREDGSPIEQKATMLYLGTTIAADGMVGSELNRRLGCA